MSVNKQLLDPLGTLCKLVSLNFNEINTKISIHNHVLSLQKPEDYKLGEYNYQFLIRMVKGDGKENVSELYYVIMRIIKWYLVYDTFKTQEENDNDYENEEENNKEEYKEENWMKISGCDEIKKLIKYACDSMRRLQETYEYGNVILAAQFYINILEDAVNGYYNDNKLPKYIIEKEKEFENLLDYEKLKNFWDYKRLKRVCDLYDHCFSTNNDENVSRKEKDILIEGQLKIIREILELADNDFQKLIQNSSKG